VASEAGDELEWPSVRPPRTTLAALAIALLLASCATRPARPHTAYLSEDEILDLMAHPRRWDGRTVTVRIYPYDNGFSGSYVLCFEPCDARYAETSPFLLYTSDERFRGYRGDRPAIVTARYSSTCFYRDQFLCPDGRFGLFHETRPR